MASTPPPFLVPFVTPLAQWDAMMAEVIQHATLWCGGDATAQATAAMAAAMAARDPVAVVQTMTPTYVNGDLSTLQMAIRTIGVGATMAQLQEVATKIKPAVDAFKVLAPMGVGTKERDGIRQMLQRQTGLLVNEERARDHHKRVRAGGLGAKDEDSLMRSLIAVMFAPDASVLLIAQAAAVPSKRVLKVAMDAASIQPTQQDEFFTKTAKERRRFQKRSSMAKQKQKKKKARGADDDDADNGLEWPESPAKRLALGELPSPNEIDNMAASILLPG